MTDKKSNNSRRKLLKSIAAGSGAVVAGKSLPECWSKPVVDAVMLPAHAQTSTQAEASAICPVFEARTNWYQTTPELPLSALGRIRLVITLKNTTVSDFELDGTFRLWTAPSRIEQPALPVIVNSAPAGTFAPGSEFTYDLTIDVSGLPDTEVAFGFRGRDTNLFGNIRPNVASIVSSSSTCG